MKETKGGMSRKAMLAMIFALAWPTMLEQLLQTAVQYVDFAMVGSLGTDAAAAVGATTTVNWLVGSTVSAIAVGFLAIIAKAVGEGDSLLVKRASGQAVFITLVSGVIFTVIPLALSPVVPVLMQIDPNVRRDASIYFFILYTPMLFRCASIIFGTALRASGDTKTPMRVGLLVNAANVTLNYLFIYPLRTVKLFGFNVTIPGLGLGVIGAAAASAIAYAIGGVCITVALYRHKLLSPKGQKISPDREILSPCLKVAFPNMCQRFGTSLGYVVFASMINSLGGVATAAHSFANTVESAFYIPGYGMQTAAATLAGNAYGENNKEKLSAISSMILKIEVGLMILSGATLYLVAPYMMRMFSSDVAVISLAVTVLRMVALSEPIYGVSIIIEGILQGVGRTVTSFKFNIIGMWGIRIAGTFICTQVLSFGLESAWGCMIAHNVTLFVLFVIHFKKGNWNPMNKKTA